MSSSAEPTAPVETLGPTVEEQGNEGDQEGQGRNSVVGGESGGGGEGGGSPVGVEDVDVPAPNVRVNVENLPPSSEHMPVEDPASLGGGDSPVASAVSSLDSSESMGDPRRLPSGGGGGGGSGGRAVVASDGGGGCGRELERIGSGGIEDCQVDDSELSGSLDDDGRCVVNGPCPGPHGEVIFQSAYRF